MARLTASTAFACLSLLAVCTGADAEFTTIINVPPTTVSDNLLIDAGKQLNLLVGGVIDETIGIVNGGEVNILGGSANNLMAAESGGTANIVSGSASFALAGQAGGIINLSGGVVDELRVLSGGTLNMAGGAIAASFPNFNGRFQMDSGGVANLSGGTFGLSFSAFGVFSISGGEYRLDGVPISGLDTVGASQQLAVSEDSVLSGTFADGTPFTFALADGAHFSLVNLATTALPSAPAVITAPSDAVPHGVRAGQTLFVSAGGAVVDHFRAGWGSTVNVAAGASVGNDFSALCNSIVNITGGSVGDYFAARTGSTINISGGSINGPFVANRDSTVNLSGGAIVQELTAANGSHISVTGGYASQIASEGALTLSGGAIGGASASQATIVGGDFRLNDLPVLGLNSAGDSLAIQIPTNSFLTGTYADGTPFLFGSSLSQNITLQLANLPSVGPTVVNVPASPSPLGTRLGQTVVVAVGGSLGPSFNVGRGGILKVQGGSIDKGLRVVAGTFEITSGSIGQNAAAFFGSHVRIAGGFVGPNFTAYADSQVDLSGGIVSTGFLAQSNSVVNISGGSIGNSLTVASGSQLNISGGIIGSLVLNAGSVANISGGIFGRSYANFNALNGSVTNLYGRQFLLNGLPISGLQPGSPFTLGSKQGTLTGVLADGASFSWTLLTTDPRSGYSKGFQSLSTLTLTLVPEPSAWSIGLMAGLLILTYRPQSVAKVGPRPAASALDASLTALRAAVRCL